MDDEKTTEQHPTADNGSSDPVEESEVVSRRKFLRKSAEVAAISLFGVLGFDAVSEKVLQRIAETRSLGQLSDAAASVFKQSKLSHFAEAAAARPACFLWLDFCTAGHDDPAHCHGGETCVPPYNCEQFTCDVVNGAGTFDCQRHHCSVHFVCQIYQCGSNDCATGTTFWCMQQFNTQSE